MIKKSSNLASLFKKFVIVFYSAIILLVLCSSVLFYIFKDDIGKEIIKYANNVQNGELIFEDISFAPFVHFPSVSIDLNNVTYFEKKDYCRSSDTLPIIRLSNLYLAVDILDLIKGNINIPKISLDDGIVYLVTHSDSTLNLVNAITPKADSIQLASDSLSTANSDLSLDLREIAFRNIQLNYNDIPENDNSAYNIKSLTASLSYWPDTIKCQLYSQIDIKEVKVSDGFTLKDKSIILETSLKYDQVAKQLFIDPSIFSFERANFNMYGWMNLLDNGFIDLAINGDDKDFSLLSLFFTTDGVENIKGGDLYFNGKIKGELFKKIPNIDVQFGLKDVIIQIPNTKEQISNLNLTGTFQSGEKSDISEAHLNIKNVKATLPGGKLDGKLKLSNFVSPEIDLDFYLKSNVTGFEQIFKFSVIDSLSGIIEIKSQISGKYNSFTELYEEHSGKSIFRFDSLSFVIPKVNSVSNIYGRVEHEKDTTYFKDLNLEIGSSDFNINGNLTNAIYTFFNVEKEIAGRLHIKSDTYDYPNFFAYDQRIVEAFPYQIKNTNLIVNLTTATFHLKNFTNTPKILFDIDHLDAEVVDFLPPVTINTGLFTLSDQDSSLNLDFANFKIDLAGSKLMADVVYNSPLSNPDRLQVKLTTENLNPKTTFVYWTDDTIPEFLDASLNAKMKLDLIISNDSIQFDLLDFTAEELNFVNAKDTLDIDNLRMNTKDVDYDLSTSSNIFETLSFKMKLTGDTVKTNYFKVQDVDDEIEAMKGIYQITTKSSQFFDKKAETFILLKPFEDIPSYKFNYKVEQFDVAALFDTFLEDTLLMGKMDIDLQLILAGQGWEEVEKNLNGKIDVHGEDLTLIGMDLDKVIKRFKRSQQFTFADVGAIFLMGPAAILVTKGSDYASLVILSPGDSSHVKEVSSRWEINNGIVDLVDVAFSTNENRMAAIGGIDLSTDTLNVHFALINDQGCSVFSQSVKGSLKEPEMGTVRVVKSLLSPVTNLLESVESSECEVFYTGSVKQPENRN